MILDYILDYGSRKTACRADLRKLKCTKNPLRVYTESISGVHGIHLRCTRNPLQVYTESISGVQGIHFRCTPNPSQVYKKSTLFVVLSCFSTYYQHFFNNTFLFRIVMGNLQNNQSVEKNYISVQFLIVLL